MGILLASATAIIGVLALTAGLQQYFLRKCNIVESLLLLAAGLACIYPGSLTDIAGLCVIGVIALLQYLRRRNGGCGTSQPEAA